jgi:hypothetical protein
MAHGTFTMPESELRQGIAHVPNDLRRAGSWRIIHEHTSAPVEVESLKPLLKR